ncbi:DNA repair protein radc [Halobacteroides halobius DSM 5150]|uniref:DNA repair protein radc n=1 Tax=Halobacteroides halobius (strain ATCC 35273 / DSM 5150 / MD-1) TaxID=748449 RepID=L0KBI1_HALHC|nr:DNA repair protein RadC [Halobacteroides halobius]AGB41895.1 DNA repair protein radc [Halobacteroides halobius DSM 5150]
MSEYFTIKDMPTDERPREKMVQYGSANLSTTELLALILRTGSHKKTALSLANELLSVCSGLEGLIEYSIAELQEISGIGIAKATQLQAVVELSQRIAVASSKLTKISSPAEVAEILIPNLRYKMQECFMTVLLDTKNKVLAIEEISKGSLNSSIVHPREVFRPAIKRSSAAIILAHNHPSGDLTASQEDIKISKRLAQAGEIIGIEVLDHLIIGSNNYSSLKTKGLF